MWEHGLLCVDDAEESDTVTFLAPVKAFFCVSCAKITTFNQLNSLKMPKKTLPTLSEMR